MYRTIGELKFSISSIKNSYLNCEFIYHSISRMKNFVFKLIVVLGSFIITPCSYAQNCKVLDKDLVGTYTGDCKNGKAEGVGKAVGTNTYEGEFKLGYPDGVGMYTDVKGNSYKGSFKKGKREGDGVAVVMNEKGEPTTVKGFWKKDKYIGEFEYVYKITNKTFMVSSATVVAEPANPVPTIEVNLESVTGGSVDLHGDIPKPTLTETIFLSGSYQNMNTITSQQKRNTYILQNLIYPASIIFKIGSEEVQVNFNEKKNYKLTIVLRS